MIGNQTTISFNNSGDSFFSNESLPILPYRFNILYGRNGSGKSSISRAISAYVSDSSMESPHIEFDEPLNDDDKKHIFVFNEDYIEKNIKVEQDGLHPIIMLGEQVELDLQIKEYEAVLNKILEEKSQLVCSLNTEVIGSVANKYEDIHKQLLKQLRKDGNWADRERAIQGKISKSDVNDVVLGNIIQTGKGTLSFQTLSEEVLGGIKIIEQTKGQQPIEWNCPTLTNDIDITYVNKLLCVHKEIPEFSEREKNIMDIIQGKYGRYIGDSQVVFNDENVNVCPLCLRPINSVGKESVIQLVKRILNKEAETYKNQLAEAMAKFVEISLKIVPNIDNKLFSTAIKNLERDIRVYNSEINKAKSILKERMVNIYLPYNKLIDEDNFNKCFHNVEESLDHLDGLVKNFNQVVEKQKTFKENISKQNKHLAYYELESLIKEYSDLSENKNNLIQLLKKRKEDEERVKKQLNNLIAQKQQITIALDFINQALSYVFFDKDRLQLTKENGIYTLLSRNKDVKPSTISVGERNIIALCYFFASMFVDKNNKDKYKDASIIIIDDPVSSFDFENRVGVISLLRWMTEQFIQGNPNTKILIMTHDIQTVFNLQKVRTELEENKDGYLELVDKGISPKKGLFNEYKTIMIAVFEFACNKNADKKSSVIGNQMRKLMEAYSSFVYARDFMSISHDNDVIKNIPGNKRLYYKNLMTRLVLNGESHEQEAANAMNITGFKFSKEEKIIIAKSIIMFLYYINPKHILSYIPDAIDVLSQWSNDGFDESSID